MALPTTSGERPPGDEGLIENLRSLAAWFSAYIGARLQLAGLESKEASWHYLKILLWLFAGLFGVTFGYIFLCIACVFIISVLLNVSWMWISLGAAILHLVLAAIAILVARSQLTKPMFGATIAEFKKDQTWLNTPDQTTRQH